MKNTRSVALAIACSVAMPITAQAGAKLEIDDDSKIDLGFRVQTLYLNNDKDFRSNEDEFRLRRARLRLKGDITQWVTAFLQTEFSDDDGGAGGDVRLIDGWAQVKPHPLARFTAGLHMSPVGRQHLTSSGGLLAADRPGITNYNLTWTNSGRAAFNTGGLPGTGSGLRGDNTVRDLGVSLFGSTSLSDMTHLKYYAGVYEGSDFRQDDPERVSLRAQLNFFDPEPGYFQVATYLGKKKTVGIGIGYDQQDDVAVDSVTGEKVDYELFTVDAFTEYPISPGSLTAEAAYTDMELDGPGNTLSATVGGAALGSSARQVSGDGYYIQAGYYYNKWQPWFLYETWDSDAGSAGSWDAWRIGLTYFIIDHHRPMLVSRCEFVCQSRNLAGDL